MVWKEKIMLKKWFGHILKEKKCSVAKGIRHHIILDTAHTAAEHIIRKLIHAGYEAYLVGGAVRDLILEITPKDFDVATNATPEQVKSLFRRSRIVGRRFPIVHVMVGRETVEVSTFRSGQTRQNHLGRVVRDNAYGTVEQDAVRRDFTCNALYYDVIHHQVLDFHRGVEDITRRRLVMIGDAAERYREDPVRVLRAVRLSGKLGFEIDGATAEPIAEFAYLLHQEPASRLFDELMKILFSGYAEQCLNQFSVLGVCANIHPLLSALQEAIMNNDAGIAMLALRRTDMRLREGKTASTGFVLAALLWPKLRDIWLNLHDSGQSAAAAMSEAVACLRDGLDQGWGVPQRYAATMREIWMLQPQFENRRGGRPFRFLAQPRFRAAYDFMLIRAETGEVEQEMADWWTRFQSVGEEKRHEMANANSGKAAVTHKAKPKKRHRHPRHRKHIESL